MRQNSDQSFKFDLNKIVHFRPDYEILDMRKISLDPDILITPQEDYIHINGLILLQGEYKKDPKVQIEGDKNREDNLLNYVKNVEDISNGFVKFNHYFPIDITLPAYRVTNLSNISVMIESFDYELTSPSKLKIMSEIEVNGIKISEIEKEEVENSVQVEPLLRAGKSESEEELISNKSEEQFLRENQKIDQDEKENQSVKSNVNDLLDENQEVKKQSIVNEKEQVKKKDEKTFQRTIEQSSHIQRNEEETTDSESIEQNKTVSEIDSHNEMSHENDESDGSVNQVESVDKEKSTEEAIDNQDVIEDEVEVTVRQEELSEETVTEEDEERDIEIQVNETEEEEDEEVQDVHFLTTIFNRTDEESYSQLRIYIVQDGDTVHSIAKRYEVASLKLLQLNNLSGEELTSGELLYIPETVESKTE